MYTSCTYTIALIQNVVSYS